MTKAQAETRLALVQNAINTFLSSGLQSYTVDGYTFQRGNLEVYIKEEQRLELLVKRLTPITGGAVRYPIFGTK